MTTAKQFLTEAASHIGTYGDYNIYNRWYWVTYTKSYSSDPGTAWCAAFMSYVAFKTGLKCNYSASASAFATQFERIPVSEEGSVKPGDIVVFNWDGRTDTGWCDHVGVVEWSSIATDGKFGTIEGNTGNKEEGEVLRVNRDNWSSYFTAFYRPKYDAEAKTKSNAVVETAKKVVETVKTTVSSKTNVKLYGIDVSSNQPESICAAVNYDFAIVKATGNPQSYRWNYVNDCLDRQAGDALKRGKKLGLYWFTWGRSDATEEAKLFVDTVKQHGLLGKAALFIDYEAEAVECGRAWVKKGADYIKKETGCTPVIYASGGVIVAQKLFDLGYPIWCANYYKGYQDISGYDTSGMKIYSGCEKSLLWQFTSCGYLEGYGGPLDMNVFYGSKEDWDKLINGKVATTATPAAKPAESKPATAKKKADELAKEVIAGKWGTGSERRERLEKAGYSYDEVQKKVNELLGATKKSVDQLAKEVLEGKWGTGSDRMAKLENAGYSYEQVQKKVNELLGVAAKDIDDVAQEVIDGKWGNGDERRERLEEAGYSYDEVQERVNEMLE